MSLTEEARTPFSLVDEINQVRRFVVIVRIRLIVLAGNGPAS